MTQTDGLILLKEASEIENTAIWGMYIRELEKHRITARQKCYERGEKEYEKGMVEAFNIILGYRDRDSLFQKLTDKIRG